MLIVYADSTDVPTQLRSEIMAEPGVVAVDLFDAIIGTPTLGQLQQYNIVVPFSNSPFVDANALGNNLADYVDGGGVVVQYGFSHYGPNQPYGVNGRWVTGNYNPYNYSTSLLLFMPFTLGSYNAGHPLMAGVSTLNGDQQNIVTLASGATQVAAASNGNSVVAYRSVGSHDIVGVTAYVGAGSTQSGHWGRVIVNAGRWQLGPCGGPTPTPTPTPTPSPALDQSVAWQNNTAHDGYDPASPLVTPLTLKWSRDLSASGVTSISYPLIAQGLVFVTIATNNHLNTLIAIDEQTGTTVWSADVSNMLGYGFANAAYDSGKVFVVNFDGLMKAFDAATGTLLWSLPPSPDQPHVTSPPTAANGIAFTGGSGIGGIVYAVNEMNGAVLWARPVDYGDHSSPAVVEGSVFVSYVCPQAYGFSATSGERLWHYSGPCHGGGGKTPVVHAGNVFVRDADVSFYQTNGLVLDAHSGTLIGGFNSDRPPAFVGNLALYFQSGILRGVDLPSGQVLWSFTGDGGLTSAPVIVNQTIYIGSSSGTLFGVNTSGQQIWSTQVGTPIPAPDEFNAVLTTGLGAGDGLLIVPAGSILAAYGN